jgi:uncharacterized protein (TIGR02246 family)
MRSSVAIGVLALAAWTAAAASAELAEQVRKTETAFAKSMADRDHAAFVSHLAEDAVFFGDGSLQRGKAEVAAAWKPMFEGPTASFSWKPEEVAVLESGTLALSSGPVYDASGKRIGTFNSVWRREKDGSWKVVFDKGCAWCGGGDASSGQKEAP